MPLFLSKNRQGKNFVFHSNLTIKQNVVRKFPKIYQEILKRWGKYLSPIYSPEKVLSPAVFELIWYNEYIKIDNNTIHNCYFFKKNFNHIGDLFENNDKMRSWQDLRAELGLNDNKKC